MKIETRRLIGPDHPSLPGHFPGAPIVPGVVILDEVLVALSEWRKGSRLVRIAAVKFFLPLHPGEPFVIQLSAAGSLAKTEVEFCCRVADRKIAEGRLDVTGSAA